MLYEDSPTPADGVDAPLPETAGSPFAQIMVTISKQESVPLKWDAQYWQKPHQRALSRETALKGQIERLCAQVRDLRQRVFGRKTERVPRTASSTVSRRRSARGVSNGGAWAMGA